MVEFQYVLEQVGSQFVGTHAIDEELPTPCVPPDLYFGMSQCKSDPCCVNNKWLNRKQRKVNNMFVFLKVDMEGYNLKTDKDYVSVTSTSQ